MVGGADSRTRPRAGVVSRDLEWRSILRPRGTAGRPRTRRHPPKGSRRRVRLQRLRPIRLPCSLRDCLAVGTARLRLAPDLRPHQHLLAGRGQVEPASDDLPGRERQHHARYARTAPPSVPESASPGPAVGRNGPRRAGLQHFRARHHTTSRIGLPADNTIETWSWRFLTCRRWHRLPDVAVCRPAGIRPVSEAIRVPGRIFPDPVELSKLSPTSVGVADGVSYRRPPTRASFGVSDGLLIGQRRWRAAAGSQNLGCGERGGVDAADACGGVFHADPNNVATNVAVSAASLIFRPRASGRPQRD